MEELKVGLSAEVSEFVSEQLTAVSVRSGLVSAYATPSMLALMENASVTAIQKSLSKGQTSVGVEVNVKHLAATPVGVRVRARADVIAIEGRRVTFKVEAWDPTEKIGEGTHTRVIVDAARFKDKVEQKLRA
ncbi:MAG: thioesterase family protein [Chloroflexota bacterium]